MILSEKVPYEGCSFIWMVKCGSLCLKTLVADSKEEAKRLYREQTWYGPERTIVDGEEGWDFFLVGWTLSAYKGRILDLTYTIWRRDATYPVPEKLPPI